MTQTNRIVIAGGGRIGVRTARELAQRGDEVVVIEKDESRAEELTEEYIAMVIQGDASTKSILEQADLGEADAIAALTDEPGTNLAICLQAEKLAPDIRTLARTGVGSEGEYNEAADATLLPQEVSAATAADFLSGQSVQTVLSTNHQLEILEIEVEDSAPVAGYQLKNVELPEGSLVISDRQRSRVARPETEFQPDERYIVGVETGVVDEIVQLFRG